MMQIRRYMAVAARATGAGALGWAQLSAGPKVSGAATATSADGRVWLWGGLDENKAAVDGLWTFYDGSWSKLAATGSAPPKAMYAAAACQPFNSREELVVCGGWDPGAKGSGGTFSDAVHALDLATMEWMRDDPLPCGPVSRHAAATVDGRIFVHTFREGVVRRDACGIAKGHTTTGDAPAAVSMCAAAALADPAALLVFGGSTKTQGFSGDAYVLDAASYEWRKLDAPGGPGPRGSCCAAAVDDKRVLIFGGAGVASSGYDGGKGLRASDETWLLTVEGEKGTWELLDVEGPPPRVAASLEPLPDGTFLLSGGWDPATGDTFDDCWALSL